MILATVLSVCTLPAFAPQEPERVMRTVPIRSITSVDTSIHQGPFGSMLDVGDNRVDLISSDRSERRVSEGFVLDFVRKSIMNTDPDGFDQLVSAVVGSRLALSGPKPTVDRAVGIVRMLESTVAAPIVVEARLFALEDGDDLGTSIPKGDTARWFGSSEAVRWSSRSATRSGLTTVLSQERYRHYLRDCDVEVAEDQSISDPRVTSLFEGIHLKVEPHALPGSDALVLYCDAALGEVFGEIETRSTGVTEMATLDVPRLANNHASFSGRIENGGALVVTFTGDGSAGTRYALAVSARRETNEPQDAHLAVWPISAITSWSLSTRVGVNDMRYGEDDHSIFPLRENESSSAIDTDTVLEMLFHVLQPSLDNDEAHVDASGGWVFVIGADSVRATALRALVTMHDQWVRSAQCECVSWLSEVVAGVDGTFGGRMVGGRGSVLHRVRFPVVMGRPHFVLRGIESTVLQDVQVEIAQEASGTDPVVASTFAGLFASIQVFDSLGGMAASANVEVSHVGSPQRRAAETRHGGNLFLSDTSRSRFVHNGAVSSGQVIELGDAGVVTRGAKRYQIRQSIQVDAR